MDSDNSKNLSTKQDSKGHHQKFSEQEIMSLQLLLKQLGYSNQVDGKIGRQTEKALKKFQKTHGIEPSGRPNNETLELLKDQFNEEQDLPKGITFSPTVEKLLSSLRPDHELTAWELVKPLLAVHGEYGGGLSEKILDLKQEPREGKKQSVEDWLYEIITQFDSEKIQEIHGRIFILALTLLDNTLRKYFLEFNFIDAIKNELSEPFESLLNIADPSVTFSDTPTDEDAIGRQIFADKIAARLRDIWNEYKDESTQSFMLHLGGAWGSGKSTFLKLIENSLRKNTREDTYQQKQNMLEQNWIPVWFNAWQHQHITPAWWPLMNKIYSEAIRKITGFNPLSGFFHAIDIWFSETLWRIKTGKFIYLIAFLLSVSLLAVLAVITIRNNPGGDGVSQMLAALEGTATAVSTILGLVGSIWSGTLLINRVINFGSSESAAGYLKWNKDPMEQARIHFAKLVEKIRYPIVVIIDDVDRCRPEYVVRLLEGIQTTMNHSRIIYIVSADRAWVSHCFEISYYHFEGSIEEPGQRFGDLFLDKIFQLSISVPKMTTEDQYDYLDSLILNSPPNGDSKLDTSEKEAKKLLREADSDSQRFELSKQKDIDPLVRKMVRAEMVRETETRRVQLETEYYLRKFIPFMEANPRSMKRLVNAYDIFRALAILIDPTLIETEVKKDQLVLWTIISLRWPILAEYLAKHPNDINKWKNESATEEFIPSRPELVQLKDNQAVRNVFNGTALDDTGTEKMIVTPLDEESIKKILGLKSSKADEPIMA